MPTQPQDLRCSGSLSSGRHPTPTHVGLWALLGPATARTRSTQLTFIKRLLCAKLRTLRWAEETSVLPAPIMYSLKEELGPPHIPGLPSPQLLLNTSAGPSIHSQPSASRRATEKKASPLLQTHTVVVAATSDLKPNGGALPTTASARNGDYCPAHVPQTASGTDQNKCYLPTPQCTRLAWPTLTACSGRCTH